VASTYSKIQANIAHWNLDTRKITRTPDCTVKRALAEILPLQWVCDPETPDAISKHQTRFSMKALGEARKVKIVRRRRAGIRPRLSPINT